MTGASSVLHLNGQYVAAADARLSIDDRGFLFADGCYEVTLVVDGSPIVLERHLARLQRGLDALRIDVDAAALAPIHRELIDRNSLHSSLASVYVQVTRGVAPRAHAFPDPPVPPTVLVRAQPLSTPSVSLHGEGGEAITTRDERWGRVDIKSIALLPNVLAQQAALDAGVRDAILHRDGSVTEGPNTNVFGVLDGAVVTAPADHRILAGVTRSVVLELAAADDVRVDEREWTTAELAAADEVFLTSTTAGVRPVVGLDGRPVGDGRRGPVTERLQRSYSNFLRRGGAA